MIDFLILVSQRHIVIALAIFGALLATAGTLMAKPNRGKAPEPDEPMDRQTILARSLTYAGYGITFVSIGLFIVAGFVSDLRP